MTENKRVLVDASIMIELLSKQDKSVLYKVDPYAFHSCSLGEFKTFTNAANSGSKQEVRNLLRNFTILPFTSEVAQEAAEIYLKLRYENGRVEVRDIFTASAAIIYDLPLLTEKTKLFKKIDGLEIVDTAA